ncbi:DUF2180 family protein [Streptomyces monticola]|uniref:DUF2180 family protein n=1 Tax=Streptomyces monticola TaxID=2666263 RepID=A0ABW2JWC2_9ACTN
MTSRHDVSSRRLVTNRQERTKTMNCYDCLPGATTTPAVAVCTRCGAALCRDHLYAGTTEVHDTPGLGRATHEVAARRITCRVCAGAERT